MLREALGQFDERRATWWLAVFFIALAVPSALLLGQAYGQLKWQALGQTEQLAEELVVRIDADLRRAIAAEEARSFAEYSFLAVMGNAAAGFVQRSPLAAYPVEVTVPGTIGHFQISGGGEFSTPLLPGPGIDPAAYGVGTEERRAREALAESIGAVLAESRLVRGSAAAFDRLAASAPEAPAARARAAQSLAAESSASLSAPGASAEAQAGLRVRAFEGDVDPFELGRLESGHFVLFRNVWRDGQRLIQGMLIDADRFVATAVEAAYRTSNASEHTDLAVVYRGEVLATLRAEATEERARADAPLHRARLSPPYGGLELAFRVGPLPRAAGSALLAWVALALSVVLGGGFLLARRYAIGQIRLARQQQEFVAAVSHELKTPLTSIRMYGEMLQSGWADEARKKLYYDYIAAESERLSRLIDNVLALGKLGRGQQPHLEPAQLSPAELLELARSKVATQIERTGFSLEVRNQAPTDVAILADPDCFAQIIINLVDNALKFAAGAERRAIELGCRQDGDGQLVFTVRDFGPGVAKGQARKIFERFYRPADERTRRTPGTGIGLALVRELAAAMGGRVDVRNCAPGAEFRLTLPAVR